MFYSFGQFSLKIDLKGKAVPLRSLRWQNFANAHKDSEKYPVLYFETEPFPPEEYTNDGWYGVMHENCQQAVYIQNGIPAFSLRYKRPEEAITILGYQDDNRSLKLGIQFGTLVALHQQCIGLHGVTLLCGNEIIILSAPSGTGKTTLAALLERYCDAVVINGDFALLHPTAEGIIFEPTPFCGTSGRCLNHRLKVDRVVFLAQGKDNTWKGLGGRDALQQFLNNAFVPTWDMKLQTAVQENILKCISVLPVNHYSFTQSQEAAEVFFQHITQ